MTSETWEVSPEEIDTELQNGRPIVKGLIRPYAVAAREKYLLRSELESL